MAKQIQKVFTPPKYKNESRIYYYPRAFLSLGLIEYGIKNDTILLYKVKQQFDKYYVDENGARFEFNKVDQTPIGLAGLKLYKYYNNNNC